MSGGNRLSDFRAPEFTIRLFCDACDQQTQLDRDKVAEDTLISDLTRRLRRMKWDARRVLKAPKIPALTVGLLDRGRRLKRAAPY